MESKLLLVLIRNFQFSLLYNYRNGLYGSSCTNDDFFIVALCMEFDLKGLKRLCLNSLECSLLEEEDKKKAINFWEKKWLKFISDINNL